MERSVTHINISNHESDKVPKDDRRKLSYFGHKDDGKCSLYIREMKLPTFLYNTELPVDYRSRFNSADVSREKVLNKLRNKCEYDLNKNFLVLPERQNMWVGGIRSQCEGVLTPKSYLTTIEDRGAYIVIPEIEGWKISSEAIYRMWLALECAMIRRECLIIVEDPALAHVTKLRTEQWRLLDLFVRWGSWVSIFFSIFARQHSCLYMFPFCLALYGFGMLRAMNQRDPASRYSECCVNKQYELDPDSHTVCDAQISLKYLRCPQYRMFKLENHKARNKRNAGLVWTTIMSGIGAMIRNIYNLDYSHHIIGTGYKTPAPTAPKPLNIFEQIRKKFFLFGNPYEPGRVDIVHWTIQAGLFYYFFLRHIPWAIQICLEYMEREYIMETTIRYAQFRNLQGEERYELPARNLYRTMKKDFPNNRILKEIYDHYEQPAQGYYDSEEFLKTRTAHKVTLREALRRWKVSYDRNW